MDTIYIENAINEHALTQRICARFPRARKVHIDRYQEVFNAASQNFRHQKRAPKLILAHKPGKRLHPTPPGYHIGARHNYYFSHMLNCVFDCRYCFLQGMYQSANYVVFVNSEDFFNDITQTVKDTGEPTWFFSGYDCDSLALDPVTGFVGECLQHFTGLEHAFLELRTKSTQIRPLLNRKAMTNTVVAYSLSPQPIIAAEEHGTPSLQKRLDALQALQQAGWPIGLRFDPLLYADNFEALYGDFFNTVFSSLNMSEVHSVSLGVFRLPKGFHKNLVRLYPDARLLAAPMEQRAGMVTYRTSDEQHMRDFCTQQLKRVVRDDQLFPCS
ncbi:MAG: radical SAM protein [Granulosicoccus sp.]